jgi:hypothetical protein
MRWPGFAPLFPVGYGPDGAIRLALNFLNDRFDLASTVSHQPHLRSLQLDFGAVRYPHLRTPALLAENYLAHVGSVVVLANLSYLVAGESEVHVIPVRVLPSLIRNRI